MDNNEKNMDNELLDFTPEGMQKLANYLTEYPEEQRMMMVITLAYQFYYA